MSVCSCHYFISEANTIPITFPRVMQRRYVALLLPLLLRLSRGNRVKPSELLLNLSAKQLNLYNIPPLASYSPYNRLVGIPMCQFQYDSVKLPTWSDASCWFNLFIWDTAEYYLEKTIHEKSVLLQTDVFPVQPACDICVLAPLSLPQRCLLLSRGSDSDITACSGAYRQHTAERAQRAPICLISGQTQAAASSLLRAINCCFMPEPFRGHALGLC